jgi:DNA-binding MarR family transcriptional regulator
VTAWGDGEGDGDVGDALMDATRALVGVAARSLAEVGDEVSLAQFRVLVLAGAEGGPAMGDLARTLAVNPSTATRLCETLEAKGLLARRPAPGNRRTVRATLTADGRRLVARSLRSRRRRLDDALRRLDPDARRQLRRSLRELTAALGEAGDHAWALGWPAQKGPA